MRKVAKNERGLRVAALKSHILAGSIALATGSPALAQDDITALKNQLRQLQERLEKMEAQQAAQPPAAAPAAAVTAGDTPGSFKLPGTNTSVTIGGFVKASAIFNDRSPGPGSPGDEQLLVGTIPLSSAAFPPGQRDKFKISAKESRLWLRTSTPSRWGPVTTHVEGDFVANTGTEVSTNGYGFRLRHAWGTVGNLGVGQTWSNLLNTSAIPEVIDFGALIGIFGAPRQPGIRWTSNHANGFWSVALENPETTIAGVAATPDNDRAPDINGKINFRTGFGTFEVAALWRRLAANTAGVNKAEGHGFAVSGAVPTFGRDRFVFQVASGKGIGRYFGTAPAPDVSVVGTTLRAASHTGGYVGYQHFWSDTLRSSIDYEWLTIGYGGAAVPGTFDKKYWSAHANLMWTAARNVTLGAELLRGHRSIVNGDSGKVNKLLLTGINGF